MGLFAKNSKSRDLFSLVKELMQQSRKGDLAAVKSLVEKAKLLGPTQEDYLNNILDTYDSQKEILEAVAETGLRSRSLAKMLALGLFEAAAEGHLDIVEYLADHGANMDRASSRYAARVGSMSLAALALRARHCHDRL